MFSQSMARLRRQGVPGTGPHHRGASRTTHNHAHPSGRKPLRSATGRDRCEHRPGACGHPVLAACASALLLVSCLNPPLEPQPLTVTLTASQESASVGQEIRFRYESRGTNLSQTVVEYGTGDSETIPFIYTGGAPVNINSQAGHFDYAYEEPGTYVARATVSTVPGDSRSSEVTVHISGP